MAGIVEFWFDFSSPYGYFASHRVDAVAAEVGRSTVWKPFMLGSVFKETGARPLVDVPLKGPYCVREWERLGRYYKVPWVLPEPFPIATLAAARAFYWLDDQDPGVAKSFARQVFATYFGKGIDVSPPAIVADIAESLDVDRDAVLAIVEAPQWKQRLKTAGDEAVTRGVCGSPFFIVDGEGFWGSDRLAMVEDWLERGGW